MTPTETPGISEVRYEAKNPVTGVDKSGQLKTVYDPAVHTDEAMLDASRRAGNTGWQEYLANPSQTSFDVEEGGIRFRVYINYNEKGVPYVGNVHPIQ